MQNHGSDLHRSDVGSRRASGRPGPPRVAPSTDHRGWRARAPGSDGPRHGGALVCDEMIIFKVDEDQDV